MCVGKMSRRGDLFNEVGVLCSLRASKLYLFRFSREVKRACIWNLDHVSRGRLAMLFHSNIDPSYMRTFWNPADSRRAAAALARTPI